ncbi:MAG: hypothetical protein WAM90_15405 [Rhodanobacter sp.]
MNLLLTAPVIRRMAKTLASQCAFNAAMQQIFGMPIAGAMASPPLDDMQKKKME